MVDVREVAMTDVPEVKRLITKVLAEFGLQFGVGSTTDAQIDTLPDSYLAHGGNFWVARAEGLLLGTVGVFPIDARTMELRKMYLGHESRGRGVGKTLLRKAVAWTRAQGAAWMVLDTVEEMTRAIAFYEANGFVRDDAQVRGSRCTRGYKLTL
jgi:putative acetyltransferase